MQPKAFNLLGINWEPKANLPGDIKFWIINSGPALFERTHGAKLCPGYNITVMAQKAVEKILQYSEYNAFQRREKGQPYFVSTGEKC